MLKMYKNFLFGNIGGCLMGIIVFEILKKLWAEYEWKKNGPGPQPGGALFE